MKSLVCIFAHPDDEAFGPSGTIAHFAKKRDVYIVSATSGDADAQFTSYDSSRLGKIRQRELRASAKILGVKGVDFLGFKDGGLCNNNYHALAEAVKEKLNLYKPETIMTFDQTGVSGHIDHIAVSMVTTFVFQKLDFVKELLYFANSIEESKCIKDYFIYFPPGYKREDVDLVIDTTAYWDTKIKAMRAHVSQKNDCEWILSILTQLPREEYFLRLSK